MRITITGLICFLWLAAASTLDANGEDESKAKLHQAEQRIRAIYERGEFRGTRFSCKLA